MSKLLKAVIAVLVAVLAVGGSALAGETNVSAELGKASRVEIYDFDSILSFMGGDASEDEDSDMDYDSSFFMTRIGSFEEEEEEATGFVITINGEDVLYVATEEDAVAVLDGVVARYSTPGSTIGEISFAEEITYQEEPIITEEKAEKDPELTPTYICDVNSAVEYILNGTSTPLTYTVVKGDSLWSIAIANGMSVSELQAMNPGITDRLSIGQNINLYEKHPYVHVTLIETATEVLGVPFDISYVDSDELYKGQTEVISPGVNGQKRVTTKYTRTNGVVVASEILEEAIVSEPIAQVSARGTKTVPIQSGSGQLSYPVSHVEISSPYGASRSGGKRSHKGIDLRNPKGTPFYAADSGTVTQAGWGGNSYGNLIIIDHGNGIQTKYAHCNSISVSVGQNVSKGEEIGTIGSTGNATGYVLHFEVVVNGTQVNPVNYLP